MKYYIKERHNPQLAPYFVALGQISQREAKAISKPKYGTNILHVFATREEYKARLKQLEDEGHYIQ